MDVLLNRHLIKKSIKLRAIADSFGCLLEMPCHIVPLDIDIARCSLDFICQCLEARSLTSSIYPEQGKTLTHVDSKRNVVYGDYTGLRAC